jgi:hypothetical protein
VRGTAQRDVLAQASPQRIPCGGCLKLLDGGNARIHAEQALLTALGQISKDFGHGLLARGPKAGAPHQADPDPANQDDRRQRGHEVGLHCPLGAMAVPLPHQCAPLLVGPQPDYGRGVEGRDGAPLTPQAHRLDGQARQAPDEGPIKQGVQRYLAPLQGAFDSMPTPAQMAHIRQGGTGEASLMVDELTSKHRDEYDPDKVGGPYRQRPHQSVNCVRGQIHWLGSQGQWWSVWLRHLTTLAEPDCIALPHLVKLEL